MIVRPYDPSEDREAVQRLWLGVRPATSLAMTDSLEAPADLLEQLDEVVCLPTPKPDWNL